MGERAAVITYNWATGEVFQTPFIDEPDAAIHAHRFMSGEVDRGDFPEPDWKWVVIANEEASEVLGEYRVNAMLGIVGEGDEGL